MSPVRSHYPGTPAGLSSLFPCAFLWQVIYQSYVADVLWHANRSLHFYPAQNHTVISPPGQSHSSTKRKRSLDLKRLGARETAQKSVHLLSLEHGVHLARLGHQLLVRCLIEFECGRQVGVLLAAPVILSHQARQLLCGAKGHCQRGFKVSAFSRSPHKHTKLCKWHPEQIKAKNASCAAICACEEIVVYASHSRLPLEDIGHIYSIKMPDWPAPRQAEQGSAEGDLARSMNGRPDG